MPEGSGDDLLDALADQWLSYLAYLVSFAKIGAILDQAHRDHRVPGSGVNLMLASSLVAALWRYAVRERLVRPDVADRELAAVTEGIAPALALYVAMIALGLFVPVVAVVGYLAIAVYIILPVHAIRHREPR